MTQTPTAPMPPTPNQTDKSDPANDDLRDEVIEVSDDAPVPTRQVEPANADVPPSMAKQQLEAAAEPEKDTGKSGRATQQQRDPVTKQFVKKEAAPEAAPTKSGIETYIDALSLTNPAAAEAARQQYAHLLPERSAEESAVPAPLDAATSKPDQPVPPTAELVTATLALSRRGFSEEQITALTPEQRVLHGENARKQQLTVDRQGTELGTLRTAYANARNRLAAIDPDFDPKGMPELGSTDTENPTAAVDSLDQSVLDSLADSDMSESDQAALKAFVSSHEKRQEATLKAQAEEAHRTTGQRVIDAFQEVGKTFPQLLEMTATPEGAELIASQMHRFVAPLGVTPDQLSPEQLVTALRAVSQSLFAEDQRVQTQRNLFDQHRKATNGQPMPDTQTHLPAPKEMGPDDIRRMAFEVSTAFPAGTPKHVILKALQERSLEKGLEVPPGWSMALR